MLWIYQEELNTYKDLKSAVKMMVSALDDAAAAYDEVATSIKTAFIVDIDSTYAYNIVSTQSEDISASSSYLNDVVIPEIDSKMSWLRNQINICIAEANREEKNKEN